MMRTFEAFERALIANPRDLTAAAMYADYLTEQGDPRGEFMQVQMALEDETRTKAERKQLQAREQELLTKHAREWLGNLAAHLLDRDEADEWDEFKKPDYRWRRGFLSSLTTHRLTLSLSQALAVDPAARFLREFQVHETVSNYFGGGLPADFPTRVPTPQGVRRHWELLELRRRTEPGAA